MFFQPAANHKPENTHSLTTAVEGTAINSSAFEWPHVPVHSDRDHSLRSGHWHVRKSPRHGGHWDTLFNIKLSLRKGRVSLWLQLANIFSQKQSGWKTLKDPGKCGWPLTSAPIAWLARNVIKCSSFSPPYMKDMICRPKWPETRSMISHYSHFKFPHDGISHLNRLPHRKMRKHVCRVQLWYIPRLHSLCADRRPETLICKSFSGWVSFLLKAISNYQHLFSEQDSGRQTLTVRHYHNKRNTAFILPEGSKIFRTPTFKLSLSLFPDLWFIASSTLK